MKEFTTEGLYPIRINDKEGYIDNTGKIVINPKYEMASTFAWGIAKVAIRPEKHETNCIVSVSGDYVFPLWGFINKFGDSVSDFIFDHLPFQFSKNKELIAAETEGRWGYIHQCFGKAHGYWPAIVEVGYIVKPTFDDAASCFSEGLACVKKDGKWGYIKDDFLYGLQRVPIDKTGDYAIAPKFDDANNFSEGLASVMIGKPESFTKDIHYYIPKQNGKWGYIDMTGTFIISPQFDAAGSFSEGLAPVKRDGKWGFIDKNGNFIIKPQYDDASCFIENLAYVKIDGKYGYIDKYGKFFIKPKFDSAEPFIDGIAIIKQADKYYYISKNLKSNKLFKSLRPWKKITNIGFDQAIPFCFGLAAVSIDGKYGYINNNGEFAIKPQYEEAHSFIGELAPIMQQGKFHYINIQGKIIWTI